MYAAQHFMVDLSLPEQIDEEFLNLVPFQQAMVKEYLSQGKLLNYALSIEKAKVWAIFSASSEMEVLEMLIDFPLTRFMQVEISLLHHFDVNPHAAHFSLN